MDASLIAFLLSAAICGVIVYLRPYHEHISIDAISDFPGKVHAYPTPRIGGLAIFASVLDARITTLDMPGSSRLLDYALVSLGFTMFAVGGYAHATNIVDGLNANT